MINKYKWGIRSLFTGWFWECFCPELWRLWRKQWWSTVKSVSKHEGKGGEDGQWYCGRGGETLGGETSDWDVMRDLQLMGYFSAILVKCWNKRYPWAYLLHCDWCKTSFTPLQVCSLRPDMNICPLAFKWRPQWRAGAVFQRELGCFVDLWHGFGTPSLWERMKTSREILHISMEKTCRPTTDLPGFPLQQPPPRPSWNRAQGHRDEDSVLVSYSVSSHSIENKLLCWTVSG